MDTFWRAVRRGSSKGREAFAAARAQASATPIASATPDHSIVVTVDGLRHAVRMNRTREGITAATKVRELIPLAEHVASFEPREGSPADVVAGHRYRAPIVIDGEPRVAEIVTAERRGGAEQVETVSLLYHQKVLPKGKGPADQGSGRGPKADPSLTPDAEPSGRSIGPKPQPVKESGQIGEAAQPEKGAPGAPPPPTLADRITAAADRAEAAARERLKNLSIPRGRNVGANILPQAAVEVATIAAARAVKAGIRGGKAVVETVRAVVRELGVALSKEHEAGAVRATIRAIRKSGDGGKGFEQAIADLQARHTPRQAVKQAVRDATGQTPSERTVTERAALKAGLKAQERAGRAGFAAGREAERVNAVAKANRRSTKEIIREATGIGDVSRDVSEATALGAAMKKAEQSARVAYRAGHEAAMDTMTAKIEAEREAFKIEKASAATMRRRMVDLVKKYAPPEKAKSFLTAVAETKTETQADAVATRLLRAVEESRMRRAMDDALRSVRKMRLNRMLEEHRTELTDAKAKIKGLQAQVSALSKSAENGGTPKTVEHMRELRMQLVDQTARAKTIRQQVKLAAETHVKGKLVRTEEAVTQDVVPALERLAKPRATKPGDLPDQHHASWRTRAGLSLADRATIGARINSPGLNDLLTRQVYDGQRAAWSMEQAHHDALMESLTRNGYEPGADGTIRLSEHAVGRGKADTMTLRIGGKDHTVTPAMAMAMYAHLTDAGARANLDAGAPFQWARQGRDGAERFAFPKGEADAVIEQVPEKLRNVVDEMKQWYSENITPKMAETYRRETGHDLQLVDGYHVTKRIAIKAAIEKAQQGTSGTTEQGLTGEHAERAAFLEGLRLNSLSMLKSRETGARNAPYIIGDFFMDRNAMVHHAAAYTHMTQPVRELKRILADQRVKDALAKAFGTTDGRNVALKRLEQLADDAQLIVRGQRSDKAGPDSAIFTVSFGRNNQGQQTAFVANGEQNAMKLAA